MKKGKGHILVVDDEESIRRNLKAFLEDEGFSVITVGTAEEGMEVLYRTSAAGAVVDIRLPGMDGNRFIERAYEVQPALAFVIYTGSMDYQISASLRRLGIEEEHIFRKPLDDMSALSAMLQMMLKYKAGR